MGSGSPGWPRSASTWASKPYPGATLGDIGHVIQRHAEAQRFSVVREYCGHGIGRGFHEPPQILHYGRPGTGEVLKEGMTFTIEPMINAGRREVKLLKDGWTVVTKDHKASAQWEHTLLVTANGAEILTRQVMKRRDQARRQPSAPAPRTARRSSQQFRQGAEVSALLRARASLFDSALTELFNTQPWPKTGDQGNLPLALLAVGGYGRGELHPFSDIDILILLAEPPDAELKGVLRGLPPQSLGFGHNDRT